jgi:hypothetical protein
MDDGPHIHEHSTGEPGAEDDGLEDWLDRFRALFNEVKRDQGDAILDEPRWFRLLLDELAFHFLVDADQAREDHRAASFSIEMLEPLFWHLTPVGIARLVGALEALQIVNRLPSEADEPAAWVYNAAPDDMTLSRSDRLAARLPWPTDGTPPPGSAPGSV